MRGLGSHWEPVGKLGDGKLGDRLDCTPELRHAGRRLIGDTLGMVDASLWISSRRAAGVW